MDPEALLERLLPVIGSSPSARVAGVATSAAAPTRARNSSPQAARAVAVAAALLLVSGPLAFTPAWGWDVAAWLVLAAAFTAIGASIAARCPDNAFGWVTLAIGATSAIAVSTASSDVPAVLSWLRSWLVYVPVGLLPIALVLFPTGRVPTPRWNAALTIAVAGAALPAFFLAVASAIEPDPLGLFEPPAGHAVDGLLAAARLSAVVTALALVLGVAALAQRVRRASSLERRQVLCLLVGAIVVLLGLGLDLAGVRGAWIVGAAALPVAAGVAILWHRLYDLDLFVNRSLVYLGLSAVLLAAFAAVILIGNLVAARLLPDGGSTLVAVAVVALGLDPLRRRLQRGVDRLLYGDRDDPYAVVTALSRGLGSDDGAPVPLEDVAEAVARSLALPFAAIEVPGPDGTPHVARWGRCHGEPVALPLDYRGDEVGRLLVTPRTVGGRLSERDRRVLADLAYPIALTVSAVELGAGLQRARKQIVTAREEERRRLRRDLHDGLGPTLAGMVMQLDAATNVLRRDPGSVEPLLTGLRHTAQDAVGSVRRVVYDLRPPALDELGLVGAIRACADRFADDRDEHGLELSVVAEPRLESLPAAVEVAALRIAEEAITNVARHAGASHCRIRLAVDGVLTLEVEDDGSGLPADADAGVGLVSMRERAAELGGTCVVSSRPGAGVRVTAILPVSGQ